MTTAPPVGVSLAVPESWWEFDIRPEGREAAVRQLVDERVWAVPELAPYRNDLSMLLRRMARDAYDSGALYLGRMAENFSGVPLTATVTVTWVTTEDPALYESGTPEESLAAVRGQVERLSAALVEEGRDPADMPKILLTGFTPDRDRPFSSDCDRAFSSVEAFVDFAGRQAEAGFDEFALHWPIPDTDFGYDHGVFERIAAEAPALLGT